MRCAMLAVAFAASLGGCASNFGASQIQNFGAYTNLEEGETTKIEIYDNFGQPHDVKYFETDESVWTYFSVKTSMNATSFLPIVGLVVGGNDMDTTIANFYFDGEEFFRKVETINKRQYVNQWVGMGTAFVENDEMGRVASEMEKHALPFDQRIARQVKGVSELTK